MIPAAEIEHIQQSARAYVKGFAADSAGLPVVFDEAENGRLVGQGMVHKILLGKWRNNYQRQPRAESALTLFAACSDGSTIAGAIEGIRSRIRGCHNRWHHI